jgi:hypothetical protein
MQPTIITVPSTDGAISIDAVAVFTATKGAFLTEYAGDSDVELKIVSNGDLAERGYLATLKHLVPEACARVSREEIEASMASIARTELINLALDYRRRRK